MLLEELAASATVTFGSLSSGSNLVVSDAYNPSDLHVQDNLERCGR